MRNYSGQILAALMILAGSQAAVADDLKVYDELKGIAAASGTTELDKNSVYNPVPEPSVVDLKCKSDTSSDSALNKKTRAHLKTWIHLRVLKQLDGAFCDTGALKIADFPIWREATYDHSAEQLATALDSMFLNLDLAKRNTPEARDLLARVLITGRSNQMVVRWLADAIDELYTFRHE